MIKHLLGDIQIRDPFVLPEGGKLYLFGSTDKDIWHDGDGFDAYISEGGLDEWAGPYPAFRPPPGFWSEKNFWAPEVYRYGGAYYMFATFKPKNGRRGTAVLKAHTLPGPFTPWSDGPVTPPEWECLDGTLFIDHASGEPLAWMVFCHEWQQTGDGEICAMPMEVNLKKAAGPPVLLFRASEAPWAAPLKNRAPGSYVTDGPFLYKPETSGPLYMLWSSFGPEGKYRIGVAVSEAGTVTGPWRQQPDPLYAGDGGHGMVFKTGGRLYLALHSPNDTPHERTLFIKLEESRGLAAGQ
jgi:hypothetical protein